MLTVVICGVVLVLGVPVLVFALQMLMALRPPPRADLSPFEGRVAKRPPIAVVIPAHNESRGIGPTIDSIRPQLQEQDVLLVVADNCSDDTAEQAQRHGAQVTERCNLVQRGKGFALDHGWHTLGGAASKYQMFLFVDADCIVHPGSVNALVVQAMRSNRPVQAMYLIFNAMLSPSARQKLSEFAYVVNSHARPLGMHRMGLPCNLVGSGMLFQRDVLASVSLASGHLVEDMQLGLTLARRGLPPVFCPEAYVTSTFPDDSQSQETQRTRWEHGRLSIMTQLLPKLLFAAVVKRDLNLLSMALDTCVPPLTLLLMLQVIASVAAGGWYLFSGTVAPLMIATSLLATLLAALSLAWYQYGRQSISAVDLGKAATYVLWKIPLYIKFAIARQTEWVKTERKPDDKH